MKRKIPISQYYYKKGEIESFLNEKSDSDHTHGNIENNGTLSNDTSTVNKVVVTDSSNVIKTINKLPSDSITHQDISGKINYTDIQDNLTSTSTNKPLSANQGKELKSLVDGKSSNTHNHGNINNDGTITTVTTNVNKVMVTDSSDAIKTINKLPANNVTHQDISGKINYTDIQDNLTSTNTDKPLSANQGKELKGFIDDKANSADVYTKTQTMTATEIRQAIADGVGNIDIFEIVSTLPTSDIKGNKFYLTPNGENINKNVYDINIYVNNNWETVDSLEFDIENYPTTSEVNVLLNGKVDKIDGKQLSKNDFTDALKSKLENDVLTEHQSLVNYIQKSQTEGFVRNDGSIDTNEYLTEHQSLTNYIQKSQTEGFVRNDGSIDTNEYLIEHQSLTNYVQKSLTSGLVKNDGTIDTNKYLTKETALKPPNYGYIDSNLILHLEYLGTEISATKTIMQTGENSTITVVVTDEKGNLLENKPVEFYINGTKVGETINTNSNGVASYTYQGSGSGEIEVQVKIGSIVSVPCNVLDCYKYDEGLLAEGHHNDIWTGISNTDLTREAEYTTIKEKTVGTTATITFTGIPLTDYRIECDVYQVDGTQDEWFITVLDENYTSIRSADSKLGEWKHISLDLTNIASNSRVRLNTGGSCTELRFKNFKLYPI